MWIRDRVDQRKCTYEREGSRERRFSQQARNFSQVAIATVKSGVGLDPVLNDRVGFLRGLPEKTV
jgi:hypothetical protein